MARWTVLDCWEGAYLRVASAWRPPGSRGCLWGALPLIQKHFQEPTDCFLVLSFLQMLPLGKEMVLLMEPGFTCLTCRSSSHFLSFLLSLLAPVWVQFLYSHTYLNAKPGSTSSKLWALNKCSWLLWTSFAFSLPGGHCLSIKTIGRKMSGKFLAQRRNSIHFSSSFSLSTFLLVSKSYSWAMALFRSVALWPDCHHSQCSVWAETQVDNQQRNTVAWFKCWFRHSLAMWHWASYFPPLLFGFLLCVAGIIDDAYLLELMEWLKMKPVLSSVQWTLAVEVIKPSRLEWNHWTWFSYSVTNSWVYSGFHNPFLNGWQHAKWPYSILFTSFLLRTAGLVQIDSGCCVWQRHGTLC